MAKNFTLPMCTARGKAGNSVGESAGDIMIHEFSTQIALSHTRIVPTIEPAENLNEFATKSTYTQYPQD